MIFFFLNFLKKKLELKKIMAGENSPTVNQLLKGTNPVVINNNMLQINHKLDTRSSKKNSEHQTKEVYSHHQDDNGDSSYKNGRDAIESIAVNLKF